MRRSRFLKKAPRSDPCNPTQNKCGEAASVKSACPPLFAVPHHYLVLPDKENIVKEKSHEAHRKLGEAMICFVRNPMGKPEEHRQQDFGMPFESTTVELLEVNQLNERLVFLAEKGITYKSAEDLLREWRLLGVIKSEIAPKRPWGEDRPSRVLNLIVQGRVPTFNLWGGCVHAGQSLYFVAKMKKTSNQTVWQLEPWTSPTDSRPGLPDIVGESDSLGAWVYVGKAGESIMDGTPVAKGGKFDDTNIAKKLERRLQLHIRV